MRERDEDYESRFLTPEQLKEFDEEREDYERLGLIYAPSSIHHGSLAYTSHFKETTLLKIEIGRLHDFIDFLFSDSEYCDHATESEAWDEFEQKELSELLNQGEGSQRSIATEDQSENPSLETKNNS